MGHDIRTPKSNYKTHPKVIRFDGKFVHHQPILANLVKAYLSFLGYKRHFFVGVTNLKRSKRPAYGCTIEMTDDSWFLILIDPWATKEWGRTSYVLAHESVHVALKNKGGHGRKFKKLAARLGFD